MSLLMMSHNAEVFLGTVIAAGADFRPQLFSIMDIATIYILLKEYYCLIIKCLPSMLFDR